MSGSVTGYQAGVETSEVTMSFALESAWGTAPATTFDALRITGESLSGQKQRTRPNEITQNRVVAPGVTQQESASGGINWNLSYGTFDKLFQLALGGDWSAPLVLDSIAADIAFVAAGNKMTSTLANKFANISVGQWIRVYGATASGGVNNGFYRVAAKTSETDITLAGKTVVNETASGGNIKIRGGMLRNGNLVKSAFIQKRFASNVWLRYPGSIITGMTLQGGVGQPFTGSFQVSSQQELNQTTDAATGGVTAAPTGRFFDGVGGFGGVQIDDTPVAAVVNSVQFNFTREGAGMDYGMGSSAAQGARWGQLMPAGQLEIYFKDFTLYTLFKNETRSRVASRAQDPDGNAYIFTLSGANLMNPQIVAGGPNQPVMARFEIEGANDPSATAVQFDRFPASAT